MLYPALKTLKEQNIDFDILSFHDAVGKILDCWEEFKCLHKNHFHFGKSKVKTIKTIMQIRKERYDVSILSFPSAKFHYNLLNFLCGAKKRIGSVYPDSSRKTLAFLNNVPHKVVKNIHDVEQNFELVKKSGIFKENYKIQRFPSKKNDKKIIGFHVGCSKNSAYKRWNVENWRKVADFLLENYSDYELRFYFGADEEKELRFFENYSGVEILKNLSLTQLRDSISQCKLFLSNDSGLMHIAVFCGVDVISALGPSDERRTGPFGEKSAVLNGNCKCRPCSHSYTIKSHKFFCPYSSEICLESVSPKDFISKIEDFLRLM
jgi:ADP-heptose:LPS heptosyltransferase